MEARCILEQYFDKKESGCYREVAVVWRLNI